MSTVRYIRTVSDLPTEGQRFAIIITTLMAGAIGAYYMNFYWNYPPVPTIALHMDPAHKQVVHWAPRWAPVGTMALLSMMLWRLFVVRIYRGISMKAAVATLFVVFALQHGVEFICLEYSAALHYPQPPPLWQMIAMFPLQVLGALFTAGFWFLAGFLTGDCIVNFIFACVAGIPTAFVGQYLWVRLG